MISRNNFNGIAPVYDKLSRLVFGRSMYKAQTSYLKEIPQGVNVLMLGGGTGWLLYELFALNPSCKVWYIEASSKMLELSQRKVSSDDKAVYFIHGTESSIPDGITFDAVVTPFYLDLFSDRSCQRVIQKIKTSIHSKSVWLVTDFLNAELWQKAMLTLMYKFFRMTCQIEASRLPQWQQLLEKNGLSAVKSEKFFAGFIKSSVFRL